MPKFGFHIPSDQQVTYWISVRLGCKMSTHYFSCSSGTGTGSTKSLLGHVTPNLCFCIRWDQRVTWCILVRSRRETSTYYFSCSGEPDAVSIKSAPGHGTLNLCFCIRGFYGSHIAFWCVRGVKHRRAIFHARVGSVQFLEKLRWETLRQTCVFHSVGSVGHVVHSNAFGMRNIDAPFFMLEWVGVVSRKSTLGHIAPNLCFVSGGICWS
jgi:hypothetical protein